MASKGDRHHRVHYQHGSGAEEILRPTLVTVSGRCYRKLTETTFGKRKDAETLECRGKKQLFTGRWVFCLTVQAVSPTVTVHFRESLVARHSYELCRQNAVVNFHIHNLCTHFFVAPWQGKMNSEHEAASVACQHMVATILDNGLDYGRLYCTLWWYNVSLRTSRKTSHMCWWSISFQNKSLSIYLELV